MLQCFLSTGGTMAEKDIIMLRQKELKRLHVIHKVLEGIMTQREAAHLISLSERQIRRIVQRIREEGDEGIRHKARGRQSKRRLSRKLKERIISLYRTVYTGFGPTLFTEKLEEREGIAVSRETVRTWLMEEDLWKKHRKRQAHRQWRERKDHCGSMLQMDGSHHDWFEDRGPECVFMGYIDDASGRVFGRFYEYEGTIPAMDSFRRYVKKYGLPMKVYLDKHTTYKSPSAPTPEDELAGTEPVSEFGRALQELGVELIHACSPQAKGRIERLFKTLQDRLVKEMRLSGISTIGEANRFLVSYLPRYNRRFAVSPKKRGDLHRPVEGRDLDAALCIKTERTVRNDRVIQHNRRLYQIENRITMKKVVVEDRIDGTMGIRYGRLALSFHEIEQRPQRQEEQAVFKLRKIHKPSPDHPWRRGWSKRPRDQGRCGDTGRGSPLSYSHAPVTG